MKILKQNTGVLVVIGPLVDRTDGVTIVSTVTLSTCSAAAIMKHNGTASSTVSARSFTHVQQGMYTLSLVTGDLDTTGQLTLYISNPSTIRGFRADFMVVPANIYDSLIDATDDLKVDVDQFGGNAVAGFLTSPTALKADVTRVNGVAASAANLEQAAAGMVRGAAASGATTTSVPTNLTEATNDHYNGRTIIWTSGALLGQASTVTDYVGATGTLTVVAMTEAPATNDTFILV